MSFIKAVKALAVAAILFSTLAPARAYFDIQSSWAGGAGGSANAITLTLANVTSLNDLLGVPISFIPASDNTGATTVAVSGLAATAVKRSVGSGLVALSGNDFIAGSLTYIVYDGTEFVLYTPTSNWQSPTITGTVAGGATYAAPAITSPTITGLVVGGATYNGITLTGPTITGTVTGVATYAAPTITNPTITGTVSGGAEYNSVLLNSITVIGSLTATGLVTNSDLVNSSTTVNGQTCTLGSTCTITASAGTITVGTTTVASSTNGHVLYNNGGTLGDIATTGSGSVVLATSSSTTVNGQTCTLGSTCTITASAGTISVGVTTVAGGTSGYMLSDSGGTLGDVATTGSGSVVLGTSPSIASAALSGTITGNPTLSGNLTLSGTDNFTGTLEIGGTALSLPVSAANGGTGVSSPTAHTIPINEGASAQNNTGTGTTGQCIVSAGSSADPAFAGCWVLLETLTGTNVASIGDSAIFTSTYSSYAIIFQNVIPVSGGTGDNLGFEVYANGSLQITNYCEIINVVNNTSGASTVNRCTQPAAGITSSDVGSTDGVSGIMYITTPSNAAAPKSLWGSSSYVNSSSTFTLNSFGGGWNGGNNAVTGFAIYYSNTGGLLNISSGIVKIYGIL